jgi:hypothetical protein
MALTPQAHAGGEVQAPHSTVAGKTLGEWGTVWWQTNFGTAKTGHPLMDETGANAAKGDVGDMFLLFGQAPSGATERTVTVPAGDFIFFPIANFEFDPIGFLRPPTEEELVQVVNDYIDTTVSLTAKVNGVPVPNLFDHRELSPASFSFTLPADNIYVTGQDPITQELTFADPGTYGPALQGGYYLMLSPLAPGETLELEWTAEADGILPIPAVIIGPDAFEAPVEFTQNVKYHITASGAPPVVPLPAAALLWLGSVPLALLAKRRLARTLQ